MNKKVHPMIVQLKQNNNHIEQGINQNDAGIIFDMKIMDGLEPFNFAGYALVTLKIEKPDGTFTYDSNGGSGVDVIDPINGRIKLNIPTSCTAQNGMHFCKVSFGHDENTLFQTMTFNYFVGEDPNASDESVIGTDEFPLLTNLIALLSGMKTAEDTRLMKEEDRQDAEKERREVYSALIALFVEALGYLEDRIVEARSMADEIYEAIASGGTIDVSTLSSLATKSFVNNKLQNFDCGTTALKKSELKLYRGLEAELTSLEEGEIAYATDTHKLLTGEGDTVRVINDSCFVASATAPTDVTKLWIDTSGNAKIMKYYNGHGWVNCNTAVFA